MTKHKLRSLGSHMPLARLRVENDRLRTENARLRADVKNALVPISAFLQEVDDEEEEDLDPESLEDARAGLTLVLERISDSAEADAMAERIADE